MKKINKKGFTLIELIAVLVIMAIIALIVTPLVMSIIKKAKVSADKRSIDAYGRSIELAIAGYLMDNGSFPTSIEQLTIEYSGEEVVCSTTQINEDSSVYLAGCTVGGRSVEGYTYGKEETVTYDAYEVGDEVTYNNVDYYVIKNSSASEDSVTLLKSEPLTVAEVNQYGVGHVNMYACTSDDASCYQTAYDSNDYGGMEYYSSATCNGSGDSSGCTTNYADSEIKYVVDAWKNAQAPLASEARLITKEEYEALCDIETYETPTAPGTRYVPQYDWIYNSNYRYWTMSQYQDSASGVWVVGIDGGLGSYDVSGNYGFVVRPVITLSKSNLSS